MKLEDKQRKSSNNNAVFCCYFLNTLPLYFIFIVWLRFVNHLLLTYLLTYLNTQQYGALGVNDYLFFLKSMQCSAL